MSSASKQPSGSLDNSLFRRNADTAPYAIIVLEGEQIQYFNPSFSRLTGYSLKTLRKWKPDDFKARVVKDYQQGVTLFFLDLLDGKVQFNRFEFQYKHKSGAIRWADVTGNFIEVEGRRQIHLVIMDITDRKMAELQYQSLVESVPVGLYITTPEGQIIDANPALVQMLGFPDKETLLSESISNLYVDPTARRQLQRLLEKEGLVRGFEAELHRLDGQTIWVLLNVHAMRDAHGRVQYYEGSLEDITESKQVEEAYRAVVEHSLQGFFILQDNIIVFTNPAGSEITGYSAAELLALSPEGVRNLVHPEDQLMTFGRMRDRLAGKPVQDRYKVRFLQKDGVIRWIELVSTVIEYQGHPAVQASIIDITEQKEAEEALQESEAKYRSFMENFQGIAYHSRVKEAPGFFHGAVELITGYTSEEFVSGRVQWHQLIHPEDWGQLKSDWERIGSVPGLTSEREYRIIRKDGTVRWLRENNRSFRDEKSKAIEIEGILLDISAGKLAEQELQESRERFRQFFENNAVYCYMVSPEGVFLDVNAAALEALGYQKSELIGKPLTTIYAPESLPKMKESLAEWKRTGQLRDIEMVILSKDGVRRTVLLSADVVRDEEGNVLHSISVQRDITELKRAEWSLQERLNELACLFGISLLADAPSLDIAGFIGGVVGLLPPAWQYPEITCARIIVGRQEATTSNFRESPWRQSADIILHGERVGAVEVCYLEEKPDADEGAFLKEERDLLNVIAERISTTIKLKQAGMALEEARARIEFFNDLMTHDLNNINQGLMLTLELLFLNPALPEQLQEQVTTALEQVVRSVTLIKRVKQFTHIDSLTQPLSKQDIVPVLRAVTRSVAQAFPHKGLRMEAQLRRGRHWVAADAFLTDVFYNLLHNAMKFDPKDTVVIEVEIGPAEEEGFLRIEIKDHGGGIPDKEKERLFARFPKDPAHRWVKGSGIGLTLVQRIIQRYGGKIWVEDRVPGDYTQGANFVILLSKWQKPRT